MRCLRAQTAFDELEIVIVTPSADCLDDGAAELKQFNHRIVEIGSMSSTPAGRAAGIGEASAPIVAMAEDHSFPGPRWAECLISAHRESWAAVGPAMCNANPRSALSWVNLALEYGPWLHPVQGGPIGHLPGHNSSYKRDILLSYGSQLGAMLEAESVLHWDLRRQGHQLYLEAEAKTFHLNYSLLGPTIPLRFQGGRMFAAARATPWSLIRRLAYAAASPLIPFVRIQRVVRDLRRARQSPLKPGFLTFMALVTVSDAVGEFLGYLIGGGQSVQVLSDMEFHRHRFMSREDKTGIIADQHGPVASVE
jgi:hypothetical protein